MSEVEVSQATEASIPAPSPAVVETNFSDKPAPAPAVSPEPPKAASSKLDNLKKAATDSKDITVFEEKKPDAVVPNPYTPNFKIKVDKQEKEMDEFFRALVKDKESEEKVRSYLQKAEAFDSQTSRYEKLKQDHEAINTRFNGIDKSLKTLSRYLNEDDMESFCSSLKIDDTKILKYAQRILQKMEMDPNQRAEAERIRQDRVRAYQLEERNNELQTSYQKQQAETGLMQTEMLLSKPEYAQVAQSFDNHVKREGAFLEEVCKQGVLAEKTTGKILTPEEAIQAALQVWSPFLWQQQAQPQAPVVQTVQAKTAPPPTLPNVSGRASSPIKQNVKSIADLKRLANQL